MSSASSARGPVWYAKYRLRDGRQVQKKLGPAWTGPGRPAAGYVTKRLAEEWLRDVIDQARRGSLPGMVQTGATFADAAAEWLRYVEHDRMRKPSTIATYRSLLGSQILPTFGEEPLEAVTTEMIDAWIATVDRTPATRVKLLAMMHGIFKRCPQGVGPSAQSSGRHREAAARRQRRHQCVLARGGPGRLSVTPAATRTPRSSSPRPSPASAAAS